MDRIVNKLITIKKEVYKVTKQTVYTYLGENGTLTTPILLKDIYKIKKIKLIADSGKKLTKDYENYYFSIVIPEEDINEWYEVPA